MKMKKRFGSILSTLPKFPPENDETTLVVSRDDVDDVDETGDLSSEDETIIEFLRNLQELESTADDDSTSVSSCDDFEDVDAAVGASSEHVASSQKDNGYVRVLTSTTWRHRVRKRFAYFDVGLFCCLSLMQHYANFIEHVNGNARFTTEKYHFFDVFIVFSFILMKLCFALFCASSIWGRLVGLRYHFSCACVLFSLVLAGPCA